MTADGSNGSNNKWIGKRTLRPDGEDKVTGRAAFGADFSQPGMLWGKVLRSPHPHARIKSINFAKAMALPGVKAVMTGRTVEFYGTSRRRWASRTCASTAAMRWRDKALYAGHAVAAVAATSSNIASEPSIEVDYEVRWVIDDEAL
jgi:CO/xanthine dehydrogenase Mo-binding subunit